MASEDRSDIAEVAATLHSPPHSPFNREPSNSGDSDPPFEMPPQGYLGEFPLEELEEQARARHTMDAPSARPSGRSAPRARSARAGLEEQR
eukprot:3907397-Heterocapsa_arctica.AAC.1